MLNKNGSESAMKLKDIKNSYFSTKQKEDRKDMWLYYVVRPISFYPTWLFLKMGISANHATCLSMLVGLVGCVCLALGNYETKIVGALFVNFWIVLDCVDGNIARFRKTSGNYGQILDAINGYIINALLFLSVGVGAFNYSEVSFNSVNQLLHLKLDRSILITLGALASLSNILSRLIYHKFINTFPMAQLAEIKSGEASKGFYYFGYCLIHNLASLSGFLTPILLLMIVFRLSSVFVIFYVFINIAVLISIFCRVILKCRKLTR